MIADAVEFGATAIVIFAAGWLITLVVAYNVIRLAVHHGIRDADRSRTTPPPVTRHRP